MAARKGIFIVAGKRTPFGAFGGKLKELTATDLCEVSSKAAISAANLDPAAIDSVFVGNVIQSAADAAYISRHVGLRCGLRIEVPALTLNRLCGSGFESVIQGAETIELNRGKIVLCGGTENMSQAPFCADGNSIRWGVALGQGPQLRDSLWSGLTDSHVKLPMGLTAENLANQYQISRQDCDEFSLRSQTLWASANAQKFFHAEISPVEVKGKKGHEIVDTDEHPRTTSLEKLATLKPVFQKNGTVTAGSASGICDGAGSIIMASEDALKLHNLVPLARLVAWDRVGCDPSIMGIGPVQAIQRVLQYANLKLDDIDLVEINEAFAAQTLSCVKALNLDLRKTNTNGGAIALGHPLGASGSRITAHLVHELIRTKMRYAIGSACIGGGQGISILLERV
jgi:acetyl-CoA acyltransferase 2